MFFTTGVSLFPGPLNEFSLLAYLTINSISLIDLGSFTFFLLYFEPLLLSDMFQGICQVLLGCQIYWMKLFIILPYFSFIICKI